MRISQAVGVQTVKIVCRYQQFRAVQRAVERLKTGKPRLEEVAGDRVTVHPVLTFPGWWVERTGRGPVTVVNSREIPKIFPKNPAKPLENGEIQRIVHQLEQKCRLGNA